MSLLKQLTKESLIEIIRDRTRRAVEVDKLLKEFIELMNSRATIVSKPVADILELVKKINSRSSRDLEKTEEKIVKIVTGELKFYKYEDCGQALITEFLEDGGDEAEDENGMFIKIQSWYELEAEYGEALHKLHPEIAKFLGKKIRVTIDGDRMKVQLSKFEKRLLTVRNKDIGVLGAQVGLYLMDGGKKLRALDGYKLGWLSCNLQFIHHILSELKRTGQIKCFVDIKTLEYFRILCTDYKNVIKHLMEQIDFYIEGKFEVVEK